MNRQELAQQGDDGLATLERKVAAKILLRQYYATDTYVCLRCNRTFQLAESWIQHMLYRHGREMR